MSSPWKEDYVGSMAINYAGEWVGRATDNNVEVAQHPALTIITPNRFLFILTSVKIQNALQRLFYPYSYL